MVITVLVFQNEVLYRTVMHYGASSAHQGASSG